MRPDQFLAALYAAISEHVKLPPDLAWTPMVGASLLAGLGLVMLLRGARWAPSLFGAVLAAFGGAAGLAVARGGGVPVAPAVGVGAILGAALGAWGYRLWLAAALGVGASLAAVSAYYVRDLAPAMQSWLGDGQTIALRPAGSVVGENGGATLALSRAELDSLWNHLAATVPNFVPSFWTILIGAGVVGLAFGWFMPRAARALWAATLGTISLGVGSAGLLQTYAPEYLAWLTTHTREAWIGVVAVWGVSLALNLYSVRRREGKTADAAGQPAAV